MAGAVQGTETSHTIFRVFQVLTLIPAWSMMAAIVAAYNDHTIKTPGGIICLFVVTLLASIWAFCILITTLRARNTALWITFWDIVAIGILIAGVATTATKANTCSVVRTVVVNANGQTISTNTAQGNSTDLVNNNSQDCELLKAAWGLAIANIVFFVITAILAAIIYQRNKEVVDEPPAPVIREKIYTEPRPRRHHHHRQHRAHRPRTERVYVERV